MARTTDDWIQEIATIQEKVRVLERGAAASAAETRAVRQIADKNSSEIRVDRAVRHGSKAAWASWLALAMFLGYVVSHIIDWALGHS